MGFGQKCGVVLWASLFDRLFIEALGHLRIGESVGQLSNKLRAVQRGYRSWVGTHLGVSYENHVANETDQLL